MKIKTSRFGTVTVSEEKILHMPSGMLGFPDSQKFVIILHKEDSPFSWYQSLDNPDLAFVVTRPFYFLPDYDVDIEDILTKASWNKNSDNNVLELYVVVNIPKGSPEKMTANFIAPVIVNTRNQQAVQYVINNSIYVHNFPLINSSK